MKISKGSQNIYLSVPRTMVNGHLYPHYDNEIEQRKQYEYWRRRDLEELLKQEGKREEIEQKQGELELVSDEV